MKAKFKALATALGIAALGATTAMSSAAAATLDQVKQRGVLQCGSNTGLAGFGVPNDKGEWTGFDVDMCRAIAAAIFDDPTKVKFVPLSAKDRFTALQSGEVDVLIRNTTWTMSRDTSLGLNFTSINYYDGQGFMVRKGLGVKSALELNGASVCVQQGTTTELNLADFFRSHNIKYEVVAFASSSEAVKAYDSGRCDAFTTDASALYAERLRLVAPDDSIVLPEIISKEPFAAAVRHGDDQWYDLVHWTLFAMINAEDLGVAQANVTEQLQSQNPEVKRLLGTEGNYGESIGLTKDWVVRIVKHVGNYGDVFERNLGEKTPLKIKRGLNALWTKGGLMYAPPVR
ncbi:MAG: amino acid ABC transporter substrate-binding protein [Chelatococcus sp.]|nr:amino acid ABC transporter substrate-binding protein [Chelatococcus sp. HY11]MBX3537539.1 amino acid ABC transporter substrate-binding protein [Chelatococcus sp.]MBX3542857.1 amino acid ABC transporter substrate-binding protein [Chelatococcus sp.]CAH1671376.1 General L-amino acid-binding periplasmic protein AapJ [Hyphomicrobiales bacterium]CAH1676419.1 General L-amino acid-binding periplasmic protein AapJ [Hyphomicrobiales bacterium]